MLEEFEEHKDYILSKTKRTEDRFIEIVGALKQIITIVPKDEFEVCIEKASKIYPDKDDIAYFALALKLNCGIWSNEEKLKNQDSVPVYSTKDLVGLFFR